jgi:hypothetical protein
MTLHFEINLEVYCLLLRLAGNSNTTIADVLRKGIALMYVAEVAHKRHQKLAVVDHNDEVVSLIKF